VAGTVAGKRRVTELEASMAISARTADLARLRIIFDRLVGKTIIKVVAGGAAGSIIGVYFDKSAGKQQGDKSYEWYLAVECSWRLEAAQAPLTSSLDDNSERGPMLPALHSLVGCTVSEIEVRQPALDLVISLAQARKLVVFCDVLHVGICWYLLGPDGLEVSVEPAGTLMLNNT
jgi:hypothetical protein